MVKKGKILSIAQNWSGGKTAWDSVTDG